MPNVTRKHKLPQHSNTMHGLQKWHNAEFEKLGWMVLAKAKGYDYKIANYKRAIKQLLESIQHVMGEYTDQDRKHDLHVLYMNAQCLHDYVAKHL